MCDKKTEELTILLKHMKHHNEHHLEDVKKYKDLAAEAGLPQVCEELEASMELLKQFDASIAKAIELI